MSKSRMQIVGEAVERCLDGTEATSRYTGMVRRDLVCLASAVADRDTSGGAGAATIADLIRAAYHLGREQAIMRVAIGLDSVAMQTPEPKGCDLCDGSEGGHHPDCARIDPVGQDHDPYPNVPIEDEDVCLGDEPKPPQSFPRGTPPPDTVKNPARGA